VRMRSPRAPQAVPSTDLTLVPAAHQHHIPSCTHIFIDSVPSNRIEHLTKRKCHKPWKSQCNGSETIVDSKRIERAILGVEGERSSFLLNLLGTFLLLGLLRCELLGVVAAFWSCRRSGCSPRTLRPYRRDPPREKSCWLCRPRRHMANRKQSYSQREYLHLCDTNNAKRILAATMPLLLCEKATPPFFSSSVVVRDWQRHGGSSRTKDGPVKSLVN